MTAKISSFLLFINRRGSISLADWTSTKPSATPFLKTCKQYQKSFWYKIYSRFIDNQLLRCVIFWHLWECSDLTSKILHSFMYSSLYKTSLPQDLGNQTSEGLGKAGCCQFNTQAAEFVEDAGQASRMPGPSNDLLWSLGCSGYPTAHGESILCIVEDYSQQVLPVYKDSEEMRTDQMRDEDRWLCRAASCTRGRCDSWCRCPRLTHVKIR